MSALQSQKMALEDIRCLGEELLSFCHPDSIITLKSWISVTKTRFEEVGGGSSLDTTDWLTITISLYH